MVTYIYFVKCPDCEDEHFDFFNDAKEFAMGCLSKKPIITQTEVNRNDFGECVDHCDLGTVWSWEDMMKDTEEPKTNVFSKGDIGKYNPDNDPEFADDDFFAINNSDESESEIDPISTVADAVDFLVKDEEEAIAGYEKVEDAVKDFDAENKEEILDTIDHIKEEEEEHIEELEALVDEKVADQAMTEDTHAKYAKPEGDKVRAFNNALKYAKKDNKPYVYGYENHTGKFFALEQPIKVSGEVFETEQEFKTKYKNCKLMFTAYPDKVFIEEACERKPVPEGMTIEQLVETMEENEDEVECTWCNDLFPKDMCRKEVNLGWLCSRCADGIMSRGESLTFKENNYWDFLDEKLDIDTSNCVDYSDFEIWGIDRDNKAVLIKRYENVDCHDRKVEQKVYDEMYDIDGAFVFMFAKDGSPILLSWNTYILGLYNGQEIIFDDARYDEAVTKALTRKFDEGFRDRDPFDHHDPDYDEDEAADVMADQIDRAKDDMYDDAIDSLDEGFDGSEKVDLEYDDLTVTLYGNQRDVDDWDEVEYSGSYTYTLDKNDVATTIWENWITEEDVADAPGGLEALEDNDAWERFLETHFDVLFDKYYDKLLDYYEDSAADELSDSYSYDDYYDDLQSEADDAAYDAWRDEQWD